MHFRNYLWKRLLQDICEENEGVGKKAILLATGAFSPIHIGHLEMFKQAKEYLEAQGYQVVGGYISPKHNDYVKSKLYGKENEFIDIDDRIKLINQAITNSGMNWIKVFDWEARQNRPRGKEQVVEKIRQLHPDVNVMFVCGEDNCHLEKYPGITDMGGFPAVATPRSGYSSTMVRNALKSGNQKELDLLLHPDVQKTLRSMPQFKEWQDKLWTVHSSSRHYPKGSYEGLFHTEQEAFIAAAKLQRDMENTGIYFKAVPAPEKHIEELTKYGFVE